ncbi:MAG: carbon-nitrogen hydrolase family protein [Geminicoccaceae bacterium]|nr:carbon-nitrogen hydrolase family protein [Geminicoccaceae bacterium]
MRVAVSWMMRAAEQGPARAEPLAALARRAATAGAELLVLPEFGALPFAGDVASLPAEPSDGPLAHRLAAIARAHRIALVAGYLEACSGRLYSAALAITAEGVAIANYRRTHLATDERETLAAGAWLSLVPVGGRKAGLLIGYDLRFPEVARALVLEGADFLAVLGGPSREPASTVEPLLRARAIENGVPVAHAAWEQRDGAGAALFGPDGRGLARAERPGELACAELPAADPERAGLAQRRKRLYQGLVAGLGPHASLGDGQGSGA